MKILKSALSAILLIAILLTNTTVTFAQTDAVEAEHDKKLADLLLLQIPEETDNPNFTITFTDPSQKGVTLAVDGQPAKPITSPHLLPALAIGDHKLEFKFTDKEETEQTLIETIIVVPRVPQIDPPESVSSKLLSLKGKGLAGSNLELYLSGATDVYTAKLVVPDSGEWEYVFEEEFKQGVYSVMGVIKKNGYASTFSDSVVFNLEIEKDTQNGSTVTDLQKDITFSLNRLINNDPVRQLTKNPDLLYLAGGIFLISFIIGNLFARIFGNRKEKVAEKLFMRMLNKEQNSGQLTLPKGKQQESKNDDKKQMISVGSIKDKLLNAGEKKDEKKEEEPKEIEKDEAVKEEVDELVEVEVEEDEKETDVETPNDEEKEQETTEETKQEDTEVVEEVSDATVENETEVEAKDDDEEESEPTVKNLSKEEFLAKYKEFDPDDITGEEAPVKSKDKAEVEPKSKKTSPKKSKKAETKKGSTLKVDTQEIVDTAKSKDNSAKSKDRSIKITLTSKSLD